VFVVGNWKKKKSEGIKLRCTEFEDYQKREEKGNSGVKITSKNDNSSRQQEMKSELKLKPRQQTSRVCDTRLAPCRAVPCRSVFTVILSVRRSVVTLVSDISISLSAELVVEEVSFHVLERRKTRREKMGVT
jgi:hypothetical protein